MSKKVFIETLGCQVNKSDTERILGILSTVGYDQVETAQEADLIMINTCNIREMSSNKAFSHIGVWRKWKLKDKPNLKIAMCGCIPQQLKQKIFARAPYVDLVFGTHNIFELPSLIKRVENGERVCSIHNKQYEIDETQFPIKRSEGVYAWLPIIEGCNFFCTYCVVPYTRGRQRSRKMEDILNEAKDIAKQGYKEIILLGQTVDSYGNDTEDKDLTLANLLRELNKIDGILRIRFLTSYPSEITDDLIQAVKELDKVCEFFHMPMQSGSTKILQKMRRRYTRDEYLEVVNKIRNNIPDVTISSDFIVGFPFEEEEDFQDTLSVMDEVNFDWAVTAAYSKRKQTPAAVWKEQVDENVKKDRLHIINDKVKDMCLQSNQKYVGRELEVLVDKVKSENGTKIARGLSRNNKVTHFNGDESLIGTLVKVKIEEAFLWCLKGKMI